MTKLKCLLLSCAMPLTMGLLAQVPQPPKPQAHAEDFKESKLLQSSDDFYNNNPVFNLRLASSTPLWMKNLVQEGLKTYNPFFERDRILLGDGEWLYSLDLRT